MSAIGTGTKTAVTRFAVIRFAVISNRHTSHGLDLLAHYFGCSLRVSKIRAAVCSIVRSVTSMIG